MLFETMMKEKDTITVTEALEKTMKTLDIPLLIPRQGTTTPYVVAFALRKGIIINKDQSGDLLRYDSLIKMIDVLQRKVR